MTDAERPLPHNLDAERSVLGACLLHADAVADVAFLHADDFYLPRHQVVYRAILSVHAAGWPTDPLTVGDALKHGDRLLAVGGTGYLIDLADSVVSAVGIVQHAEIVKEHAQRRRLLAGAQDLVLRARDGGDISELLADASRLIASVSTTHRACGQSPAEIVDAWGKWGPLVRVSTGFPKLDAMTGGGPPIGVPMATTGAPDSGKTTQALQMAESYMKLGFTVGILAADSDPDDYNLRLLQRRGWSRQECERRDPLDLVEMGRELAELPLRIYSDDDTIESAARDTAERAAGKPALLIIDSVQTARSERDRGRSIHEDLTGRTKACRAVATSHKLLVNFVSEMNRGGYKSRVANERTSDMASGNGSGSIEYAARLGISLRSVEGEKDVVEMRVWKNKFGPEHRDDEDGIFLRIDRDRQRFVEATDYVPQSAGDAAEAKAAFKDREALEDAARLAVVVARQPGITATKCEPEVRVASPGKKLGHTRFATARAMLRATLVEIPGKGTTMHLYINGDLVPPEVLEEVPIAVRPMVAAARAKQRSPEAPRGSPGCPGEGPAPAPSDDPPPPLRSRAGGGSHGGACASEAEKTAESLRRGAPA